MSARNRKPTQPGSGNEAAGSDAAAEVTAATAPAEQGDAASGSASPGARKEPPPEKPADARRRTHVVLSFWALILTFGLPIWWHTTSIYRANLPLNDMMDWAEGRACRPVFPLTVALDTGSLPDSEAQALLQQTQQTLDAMGSSSGHQLRLESARQSKAGDDRIALTVRLAPGETRAGSLHPEQPVLDVVYTSDTKSDPTSLSTFVAEQLRSTFAEERVIVSNLISEAAVFPDDQQRQQHQEEQRLEDPEVAATVGKRSARSVRYSPTYHLTFSLFTAGSTPSGWDIDAAIKQYMRPFLNVLGPIHNFTIDTQIQLYAAPGVQSELLSKEDLSSFINAAEWPLSPSIGGAPTINFIIYVGSQTIALDGTSTPESGAETIAQKPTSQSWLIPQWGTVYLLPPTSDSSTNVAVDALRTPMLTFSSHLLLLLGTPQSGSLPLRLSTLSRVRAADLVLRASSTLGSLARLSRALPGIAIPRSVAEGVSATMAHLRLACDGLGTPQGLAHARVAEAAAERAFFEKSMVGQLYFPDEHKVAVYLPLLGPIGVPLVMSLLNEFKAWRKRRREAATAKAKKTE
ncbi:hypothetical protein GGTG_09803 [Gaeumannomyces tritici R3-111a-1]|uniref:GPI transamidase component PIG-S n=1 Tax=Gaeumannomyces tritici (strain R3-111a-1) TaxID=644352 RepID=J3P8G9_GAET3|nr:hypothetical protein GGTG_09803 [Gaeumannomyces tritici R3-111a-1]EJT72952.1 hypothetical protein GGTG_09803 [Gaeumannomyces tritici R3-111a-1]